MRILVICLKICHLDSLSGARVCLTTMNGSMILVSKRDNMMPECRIRAGGEGPIEKSYFDRCKAFEPSLKILFLEEKKKKNMNGHGFVTYMTYPATYLVSFAVLTSFYVSAISHFWSEWPHPCRLQVRTIASIEPFWRKQIQERTTKLPNATDYYSI